MDKQLFDDAIGEVPSATFDADGLVTRGRRAVRLHRLANPAVAAAVAVVVLTGAVAFTMTRDDGGAAAGAPPIATTATTTSPAPRPPVTEQPPPTRKTLPACDRTDLEPPEVVMERLTAVANAAVRAQRPGLGLTANLEYPDGVWHEVLHFFRISRKAEPAPRTSICDEDAQFMAGATTIAPEGKGNITVAVSPDYYDIPDCLPEVSFCKQVTTPDGDYVTMQKLTGQGGSTQYRVDIERPDGTEVTVSAGDVHDTIKSAKPPTASAVPFTLDQLVAIGTDAGMTLFP